LLPAESEKESKKNNPNAGIDAVGWLVSALVAVIIAIAAVIAYEAIDTTPNAPVSKIVAR
jgi:cell division septal protein FtsQ